jgi:hypothetical protein
MLDVSLQRTVIPALVLAGVVAAGCGNDDDGGTADQTTTTTSVATTTTTEPAPASEVADGVERIGDALLPTSDTPTVGVTLFLDPSGRPTGPPVLHDGLDLARRVLADAERDEEEDRRADLATQLLDGDGRILLSIPVTETDGGDLRARVVYTAPIERDLAALRIVRGDDVLHERQATTAAPNVEVHQPGEGDTLDPRRFEITYSVSHPDDVDTSIFVDVVDQHRTAASLSYDAPPERFEFSVSPGLDRLPLADGPVDVYVGAFDGTRATLIVRPAQLG